MARLNVNPTRMELAGLREKLDLAKRGHKLLKDKQDVLIRDFISLADRAKNLRHEVEAELTQLNRSFVLASAVTDEEMLLMNLSLVQAQVDTKVEPGRVLNIQVPHFRTAVRTGDETPEQLLYPYSYQSTSSDIDEAAFRMQKLLPRLVRLAQYEKSCQMLAGEIQSTRRRVSALEFRTIPDIEETIAYILMRIDEGERNNIARLMKLDEQNEATDKA